MALSDDIKSRLDIVDVVSHYVPLQKSGRSFRAVCPFHAEKTPSFFVFPERQTWRCFGACAIGGDVFNFVMRVENLSFVEALRRLAQQAGISMPSRTRRSQHEDLYQINERAAQFFHRRLASPQSKSAQDYLEQRGLTPETVERFLLGISPSDGESLMNYLTSNDYTLEQLATAGLVTSGQDGGYRDLFRGRLMFPIRNPEGRVAGFGGRSLDDTPPKYLNSPVTPVFDKGRLLYGFDLAKEAMRDKGAVVVEGYIDAIMPHQHGFTNVVCSMGTALTEYQAALLTGVAPQVVLALDPDAAGQEATFRSLESSWRVFQRQEVARVRGQALYHRPQSPILKVALLPQGKDPDEITRNDPQQWENLISQAVPLMEYLYTALRSRLDLSTAEGKAQAAEMLFPLIAAVADPIAQEQQFRQLSSFLGVSQAALEASLGRPWAKRGGRKAPTPRATSSPFSRLEHDPLEEHCLTLLIHHPQLKEEAQGLTPDLFARPENREVFTWWSRCTTIEELRDILDEKLTEQLDHLVNRPLPPADVQMQRLDIHECIRRLKERRLRELKSEEELRLAQADLDEVVSQQAQILQLNESMLRIFTKREQ